MDRHCPRHLRVVAAAAPAPRGTALRLHRRAQLPASGRGRIDPEPVPLDDAVRLHTRRADRGLVPAAKPQLGDAAGTRHPVRERGTLVSTQIKLGLVQPRTWYGDDEPKNVDDAQRYVAQAAALGVDLLLFPENYPGPYRSTGRFEVVEPMR